MAAGAVYVVATESPWLSLPDLALAAVLLWCARYSYAAHRAVVDECEHGRQAAVGKQPDNAPYCRLDYHSRGYVHGTDCTRPPDPVAELYTACCPEAFVTRGTRHEPTCPTRTTRSNAA
ncbi:hypothetical protein ACYBSK_19095 [Streptomyces sp. BYX5S]